MDTQQSINMPSNSEILRFCVTRNTTALFKQFLFIVEELTDDHDEAMIKLIAALPPEHKSKVELADYLSDTKIERIRKKILGLGNDSIRDIHNQISQLNLDNKDKE